jgi:hypothetical protein
MRTTRSRPIEESTPTEGKASWPDAVSTTRKTVENRFRPRPTSAGWSCQLKNSSAPIAVAARAAWVTANPRRAV